MDHYLTSSIFAIAIATSLGVGFFAWQRRSTPGALPLAISSVTQALTAVFHAAEVYTTSLGGKIFWDKVQWIGFFIFVVGYFVCVIEYSQGDKSNSKTWWLRLEIIPSVLTILVLTDPWHHWFYPNAHLVQEVYYTSLLYDYGLGYWLATVYIYLIIIAIFALLLWRLFKSRQPYFTQTSLIIIALLIPTLGAFLTIANITVAGERDYSHLTFTICNVLLLLALFYYRLFDLVPIAYDRVVANLRDGVIVLDLQARIVDLNSSADKQLRTLFDTPPSQFIGYPITQLFSPWFKGTLPPINSPQYQEITLGEGAAQEHLEISLLPLFNNRQLLQGSLLVIRDITAREYAKQIEHEQLLLKERLQQEKALSLLKSQFIATTSHEFRTPLAVISTSAYLLRHHWEKMLPEKREQSFAKIEGSVMFLKNLLEDIHAIDELNQEVIAVRPTSFELQTACQAVIMPFEDPSLPPRITFSAPPNPLRIFQDQSLVQRILNQLLSNAIKFSPSDAPIVVSLSPANGTITLIVKDQGIGIPKADQSRLFEPFMRASNLEAQRGLGIGLTRAKRMAEAIHGSLRLESEGNQRGTTCIFEFPAHY